MGALVLSPEEKGKIDALVAFASKRENWFIPGSGMCPGDHEEYCVQLTSYRCVFTYTFEQKLYRQLSISTMAKGKLPSPVIAMTIATLFGFTGGKVEHDVTTDPGPDWQVYVEESYPCVVLMQAIGAVS